MLDDTVLAWATESCDRILYIYYIYMGEMTLVGWASGSYDKDAEPCDRNLNLQPERFCNNGQDHKTRMNFQYNLCSAVM